MFALTLFSCFINCKKVPRRNEIVKITNENSRACFNKKKPQKVQAEALIPKNVFSCCIDGNQG